MKISLLITLLITSFSFGQKPSIGIKAGLAFSNATIKPTYDNGGGVKTSTRTGVLGGVYLDVPAGQKIIFRPGMEVVSKGARENDEYSTTGYPVVFTFIDFPISVLYKVNCKNGHLITGGGPFVGFPISDYYNMYPIKIEFGINGLIGYQLPIGYSVNLNYSYGLSNASKNPGSYKKISDRYFGITLGYTF